MYNSANASNMSKTYRSFYCLQVASAIRTGLQCVTDREIWKGTAGSNYWL